MPLREEGHSDELLLDVGVGLLHLLRLLLLVLRADVVLVLRAPYQLLLLLLMVLRADVVLVLRAPYQLLLLLLMVLRADVVLSVPNCCHHVNLVRSLQTVRATM